MNQDIESAYGRWQEAGVHLARLRSEVNSAEVELFNATAALGRAVAPKDAKDGESFCMLMPDGAYLQVTLVRFGDYTILVRKAA